MTTNRNTNVPARDDDDRAARFLALAAALSIKAEDAYLIADSSLDVDRDTNPLIDSMLLLARASYTGDDDFDDFRFELRTALGWAELD